MATGQIPLAIDTMFPPRPPEGVVPRPTGVPGIRVGKLNRTNGRAYGECGHTPGRGYGQVEEARCHERQPNTGTAPGWAARVPGG